MTDIYIDEKEKVRKNLLKFTEVVEFLLCIGICIDEEFNKNRSEIFSLLYFFDKEKNIVEFNRNLILWKKWEKEHKKESFEKSSPTNYLIDNFRSNKSNQDKLLDLYSEFLVGGFLLEKFGVENVYINVKAFSTKDKDVDFMVKFESEEFYIEVKTLYKEESKKEFNLPLIEINKGDDIKKLKEKIEKLSISYKKITFKLFSYDGKKGKEHNSFLNLIEDKLTKLEIDKKHYGEDGVSYFFIEKIEQEKGIVIGESVTRMENKFEYYLHQFKDGNNILILNTMQGAKYNENYFNKLFGSNFVSLDDNGYYTIEGVCNDGLLANGEGRKIGLIINFHNFDLGEIKYINNEFGNNKISINFINMLKN